MARRFYTSKKTRCVQCRRHRTCWRFPVFRDTEALPFCSECLIPIVGVDKLRRLKRLGLIAITLPKETEEASTLF